MQLLSHLIFFYESRMLFDDGRWQLRHRQRQMKASHSNLRLTHFQYRHSPHIAACVGSADDATHQFT